jgi:glutamyl endopeptidase
VRVASGTHATTRAFAGATGDLSAGFSPVAAQVLKAGKASAAEIEAASNESVIGLDDRTRIFETAMSPWRMICAIRCWWGTRISVGTGALIGPNTLLTAGHVVIPRERRTVPDRIEIYPGLNGPQQPYGLVHVSSISVHPRWVTDFGIATDVAAIHLAQPIGLKVGWFGAAMRSQDELRGAWAHVSGYPGEKLEATDPETGQPIAPVQAAQLWHHSAPIINVQNDRIFYAADTTPGQSGAPIYVVDPAVSPTPVIVGVHAYGKASTPVAIGNANSGAWINAELFDLIAQWREESARLIDASTSA